ncbi:PAS domain-containing sensor histidine kinase [Pedobacter hartonius]|uniref:histidine kinase n=1 Tax=Pedobacter hartonius TaxID=425514 RepID=A0A1H3W0F1_9SPHI|nr:PAS domain-containing sensor histidine kinase [Pedobacter hartonius]SDZ80615.1 two-component system, OmpR family, sensor histidine kinase VicK [Pedobacter hartonius]
MTNTNPFESFAKRSNDLFFIFNLQESKFTYMNAACLSFFGPDSIDIDKDQILEAIHADDRGYLLSKINDCIHGEQVADLECRITPIKDQLWLRIKAYLICEEEEQLIIGQAEDISVYKENMENLNNHNIKKNTILTVITHDLAGPIGTIQNLSDLLSRETSEYTNPKVNQYIDLISKISKSSIRLIRDFIDREFRESADLRLMKTRVELVEKTRLAAEDFLAMQIQLRTNFSWTSNKSNIYIDLDEDKFMQVINNLISNALKFTRDGGNIHLDIRDTGTHVVLSLGDDGIGIPKKYQATLFDKFTDAGRTGLNGEHSTGLGMYIIKSIVEWHGGKIWFETEENKGTTFYIELPK